MEAERPGEDQPGTGAMGVRERGAQAAGWQLSCYLGAHRPLNPD